MCIPDPKMCRNNVRNGAGSWGCCGVSELRRKTLRMLHAERACDVKEEEDEQEWEDGGEHGAGGQEGKMGLAFHIVLGIFPFLLIGHLWQPMSCVTAPAPSL